MSDRAQPTLVTSPCVRRCRLDVEGVCLGCLRTSDEIAGWASKPREEQAAIVALLHRRRLARMLPGRSADV